MFPDRPAHPTRRIKTSELTLDFDRTFKAYICPVAVSLTLYTFPKAPCATSQITSKFFSVQGPPIGNSGKKEDSIWETGQAVLLDSYAKVSVDSFHL